MGAGVHIMISFTDIFSEIVDRHIDDIVIV